MSSNVTERLLEEIGGLTVVELADLVDALKSKFNISTDMPVAVASAPVAGAAVAAAEEKSAYKVTLKDSGTDKIKVIKALRAVVSSLSLSDAKKAVDETPTVIAESASKDDAQKMKKELEAVGAKVELS